MLKDGLKDGAQSADMFQFEVLEVVWQRHQTASRHPCEEICQGLRHTKDERGSRLFLLLTFMSVVISLDLDAVVDKKDWLVIPATKAVTGARCCAEDQAAKDQAAEDQAAEDMNLAWAALWLDKWQPEFLHCFNTTHR